MKKIGLVVKRDSEAKKKADELEVWLRGKGAEVLRRESLIPPTRKGSEASGAPPEDLYCVLVVGGDGTFLSAVRWIGDLDIPILGIKFGEVGFLAEITEENLFPVVESILARELRTELRMRLLVTIRRGGETLATETVLNDLVINKGALARLAGIKTAIDDHHLTTYRADGLIIATPTGSTAYSLAAGGPVIHPGVAGILMTPICPFTLTNRPLVVPETASIKIVLDKGSTDILATFDGQAGIELTDRDMILVRKGDHPVRMITLPDQNYYDVLKSKLRWSGGRV